MLILFDCLSITLLLMKKENSNDSGVQYEKILMNKCRLYPNFVLFSMRSIENMYINIFFMVKKDRNSTKKGVEC